MRSETSALVVRKKLLLMFIFGLFITPGLTQANDDLTTVDSPVPKLYTMPVTEAAAVPALYASPAMDGDVVPTVINELEPSDEETSRIFPLPLLERSSLMYLNPVNGEKIQVLDSGEALKLMQNLGLGINSQSFENFSKIVPLKFDGRILLNVDDLGKAYLADAKNNKLIYLGKPVNAFKVLKNYSLGIPEDLVQALGDKKWTWLKTVMNNDETTTPKKVDAFSITFGADGEFTGTTDCNNYFGEYTKASDNLDLGRIASTRMFCQDSQEMEFTKALAEVQKFLFNEDGQLVLSLKLDSGEMIFE